MLFFLKKMEQEDGIKAMDALMEKLDVEQGNL